MTTGLERRSSPQADMTDKEFARLEEILWPWGEQRSIWMIVDSARDRRIHQLLWDCHFLQSCLYSGVLPPVLERVAPYLIQLEYEDRDTRRFLMEAWGNSWGVLLRCNLSIERLRRHLRGFLTVADPVGKKLVFRYYDPRVLRVYLPTCNRDELATVFGPIECFWTESDTQGVLQFKLEGANLKERRLPLDREVQARTVSPE